jgi:hypothetical protein
MTDPGSASRGALGGSGNEDGSEFRARVGALLATAIITGSRLSDLDSGEAPVRPRLISAEADSLVDDLKVTCEDGSQVFFQAKVNAGTGSTRDNPIDRAVRQFAAAIAAGLGPPDHLVLVTKPTGKLRRVKEVLARERLPEYGGRTAAEVTAMNEFEAIALRYLDAGQLAELRRRLFIWEIGGAIAHLPLGSRLEAGVVPVGSGAAAADALSSTIRQLSRARGGLDGVGLVQRLLKADVPLRSDVEPSSAVAAGVALRDHRIRERRRGESLRLYGVGGDLGHLPLEHADCVVRASPDGDERHSEALPGLVRRRGRLLVVGRPGGGKSTAIRALSAHAARDDGSPTPIRVDLRRIPPAGSITGPLLDIGCEDADPLQREALRTAIAAELAAGRCLVLLDGFDEVRTSRARLAERLVDWLGDIDEGNEVVVTTRPFAAEAAQPLGLDEAQLMVPDRPETTVDAILAAFAVAEGRDDDWVTDRVRWVRAAFNRDPSLSSTPLTVVSLATLAARGSDPEDLPRTRAEILLAALFDLAQRWDLERSDGDVRIGALDSTTAREALRQSLPPLCDLSLRRPAVARAEATAVLETILVTAFGLPSGGATAAADGVLQFWESAGVFEFEDDDLVCRIRPLAEVGLASIWGDQNPQEMKETVATSRLDADLWDTLALAAGLSPPLAAAWSAAVIADGGADEFIAFVDALRDGAELSDADVRDLVDKRGLKLLAAPDDAERVAEAIVSLDLDPAYRDRVTPQLVAAAAPERQLMMTAMTVCAVRKDNPAAVQSLRDFLVEPWPARSRPVREDKSVYTIEVDDVDSMYKFVHEQASVRLAELSPDNADLIADRFHASSIEASVELRRIWHEQGRNDLADRMSSLWRINFSWSSADDAEIVREGIVSLLRRLAQLSPPALLTQRERRQLPHVRDVFTTGGQNWLFPHQYRRSSEIEGWFVAIAVLAGFDLERLSAEASLFADEIEAGRVDEFFATGEGTARRPTAWDRASSIPETLGALVQAIGVLPTPAHSPMQISITSCPDRALALQLLRERLPRLLNRSRTFAGELILLLLSNDALQDVIAQANEWLDAEDDAMLAIAAAAISGALIAQPIDAMSLWQRCLDFPDEAVRDAALDYVDRDSLTDGQRNAIQRLRTDSRQPYHCTRCGTSNPGATACETCHSQAPETVNAIDALLEAAEPAKPVDLDTLLRLRRPRRIRRPSQL